MNERLKNLLVLGREHYERREYDRAEQVFREILEIDEGRFADVHNMLAFVLHGRGDLAGAERHFERAVEINPRYMEALMNLAVTYSDVGKYEAAHGIYARIRDLEGGDKKLDPFVRGKIANMHADVAQAYADAGCREEAIEELRKAIGLCPSFADLHLKLGNLYREGNDFATARDHYAAACTVNPKYVPARVLLGATLLSLGQPSDAIAELNEALAIDPGNKNAQMYLRMAEGRSARSLRPSLEGELVVEITEEGYDDAALVDSSLERPTPLMPVAPHAEDGAHPTAHTGDRMTVPQMWVVEQPPQVQAEGSKPDGQPVSLSAVKTERVVVPPALHSRPVVLPRTGTPVILPRPGSPVVLSRPPVGAAAPASPGATAGPAAAPKQEPAAPKPVAVTPVAASAAPKPIPFAAIAVPGAPPKSISGEATLVSPRRLSPPAASDADEVEDEPTVMVEKPTSERGSIP
jgi:tetratricopeptide (TPR) repeat protein